MHEPSTLPEMSSSPLGDQLRSYTSAQCPRSAHTGPQLPPPLSRHSITIPSSPADASVPPDGSHRTAFTGFAWPLRSCTNDTASPDCAPTLTPQPHLVVRAARRGARPSRRRPRARARGRARKFEVGGAQFGHRQNCADEQPNKEERPARKCWPQVARVGERAAAPTAEIDDCAIAANEQHLCAVGARPATLSNHARRRAGGRARQNPRPLQPRAHAHQPQAAAGVAHVPRPHAVRPRGPRQPRGCCRSSSCST